MVCDDPREVPGAARCACLSARTHHVVMEPHTGRPERSIIGIRDADLGDMTSSRIKQREDQETTWFEIPSDLCRCGYHPGSPIKQRGDRDTVWCGYTGAWCGYTSAWCGYTSAW